MASKYKSLLITVTIAVLVVGVVAWKFVGRSSADAPHLERYLPSSTIAFIQVYNLRAQTLNIAESDAWKEYSKTNPTATSLLLMGANHAGILDASYALALTGVGNVNGKPTPSFALIGESTDSDSKNTFRRLLSTISHQPGASAPRSETYGAVTIQIYDHPNGESLAYALTGDLIIVGNGSDVVKSVLDAHDGKSPSLADNAQLTQVRTQIGYNDGMFGFVDGVAITKLIDSLPVGPKQNVVSMFREFIHASGADSAQSVAMTSSFANGRVVERYTIFAKNGGQGALHTVLTNPGTKQDLLNLVPENANMVADASIANAAQTFDQLAAMGNQIASEHGQPSADDLFQQIFTKTGIDVRNDFIQSLGSEACLANLSVNGKARPVALLNLTDPDKFNHVMDQLAQRNNKTVSTQDYQGTQIKSIVGDKGEGIFYSFISSNFVASSDIAAVQQVIDTVKSGKSMSASDTYRGIAAQFTGSPQFVLFGSNRDYLGEMGGMLANQGTNLGPTTQTSNLPPSFAYGVAKQDGLYVESYSPLGIFPRLLTTVTSHIMSYQAPSNHTGD